MNRRTFLSMIAWLAPIPALSKMMSTISRPSSDPAKSLRFPASEAEGNANLSARARELLVEIRDLESRIIDWIGSDSPRFVAEHNNPARVTLTVSESEYFQLLEMRSRLVEELRQEWGSRPLVGREMPRFFTYQVRRDDARRSALGIKP